MALTSLSEFAAAAGHGAAAGVRTVKRTVVRRADAWLYGLDQQYPEYDAYRSPRRVARAVRVTTFAAESMVAGAIAVSGVLANRWAQRSSSETSPATLRRGPGVPMPRAHVDDRAGRVRRVQLGGGGLGGGEPVRRTDSSSSPGSDVSDAPGSYIGPAPGVAANPPTTRAAAVDAGGHATDLDTRHTSAIPSTFAPGAA